MAHYAFLDDNNIVTEVIVGIDETELIEGLEPEIWYGKFRGQICKRTSYNHQIRKKYACIGDFYDSQKDAFISPQPWPSWILDETSWDWKPPVPKPPENVISWWSEEDLDWIIDEQDLEQ